MLSISLSTLAHQVNSWFAVKDVEHLIKPRLLKHILKARWEYGDFKGYDAFITSTKIANKVVVTSESTRMHFFLHDDDRIRSCVWDGDVQFDDKMEIACSLVKWLKDTQCSYDHLLRDYEDDLVFTDAIRMIENAYTEEEVDEDWLL